jgi:hypothetical protein
MAGTNIIFRNSEAANTDMDWTISVHVFHAVDFLMVNAFVKKKD